VSFAAITLCVASQRVFIVADSIIDSVRKRLDTSSYVYMARQIHESSGQQDKELRCYVFFAVT
jgi:hypothetical protein